MATSRCRMLQQCSIHCLMYLQTIKTSITTTATTTTASSRINRLRYMLIITRDWFTVQEPTLWWYDWQFRHNLFIFHSFEYRFGWILYVKQRQPASKSMIHQIVLNSQLHHRGPKYVKIISLTTKNNTLRVSAVSSSAGVLFYIAIFSFQYFNNQIVLILVLPVSPVCFPMGARYNLLVFIHSADSFFLMYVRTPWKLWMNIRTYATCEIISNN